MGATKLKITTTVVPATSSNLRFGAKVAPCGRWDTALDINTAKTVVGTLKKWPAKAGGRSPKGPALAGTTVRKQYRPLKYVNYTNSKA